MKNPLYNSKSSDIFIVEWNQTRSTV